MGGEEICLPFFYI